MPQRQDDTFAQALSQLRALPLPDPIAYLDQIQSSLRSTAPTLIDGQAPPRSREDLKAAFELIKKSRRILDGTQPLGGLSRAFYSDPTELDVTDLERQDEARASPPPQDKETRMDVEQQEYLDRNMERNQQDEGMLPLDHYPTVYLPPSGEEAPPLEDPYCGTAYSSGERYDSVPPSSANVAPTEEDTAPKAVFVGPGLEGRLVKQQMTNEMPRNKARLARPAKCSHTLQHPRSLDDLLADFSSSSSQEDDALPSHTADLKSYLELKGIRVTSTVTSTSAAQPKQRKKLFEGQAPRPGDWVNHPSLQNPKWYDGLSAAESGPFKPVRVLAHFALAKDRALLRALHDEGINLVERENAIQGADLALSARTCVIFRDLSALQTDLTSVLSLIHIAAKHYTRVLVVFALASYSAFESQDDDSPLQIDRFTDEVSRGLRSLEARIKHYVMGVDGVLGKVELVFAKKGAREVAKVLRVLAQDECKKTAVNLGEKQYLDWTGRKWLSDDQSKGEEVLTNRHQVNSFTAQYVLYCFGSLAAFSNHPQAQSRLLLEPVLGAAITNRLLAPLPKPHLAT